MTTEYFPITTWEEAHYKPLYKVTGPNLEAVHGARVTGFTYEVGKWTPLTKPIICLQGYHVTPDPMQWPAFGMRVFEFEGWGRCEEEANWHNEAYRGSIRIHPEKVAIESIKLTKERPDLVPEWWHEVERGAAEFVEILGARQELTGEPDPGWKVHTELLHAEYHIRNLTRGQVLCYTELVAPASRAGRLRAMNALEEHIFDRHNKKARWLYPYTTQHETKTAIHLILGTKMLADTDHPFPESWHQLMKQSEEAVRRGYNAIAMDAQGRLHVIPGGTVSGGRLMIPRDVITEAPPSWAN